MICGMGQTRRYYIKESPDTAVCMSIIQLIVFILSIHLHISFFNLNPSQVVFDHAHDSIENSSRDPSASWQYARPA